MQASADLAAAMGTDIDSAAQTLSYSLLDPENGLRRLKTAGIAFTEAEKEQIKTLVEAGNEQEAQLLILNKVEESYKGMAKAIANTDTGKLKQISSTWGDIKENLGKSVLDTVSPFLDSVLSKLNEIQNKTKTYNNAKDVKNDKKSVKDYTDGELRDMIAAQTKKSEATRKVIESNVRQMVENGQITLKDFDQEFKNQCYELLSGYAKVIVEAQNELSARADEALKNEQEAPGKIAKEAKEKIAQRKAKAVADSSEFLAQVDPKPWDDLEKKIEKAKQKKDELVNSGAKLEDVGAEEYQRLIDYIKKTEEEIAKLKEEASKAPPTLFEEITRDYGSLSKTFQAAELDEEIKRITKVMENLGDKDKAVCEEIIKSLEEQKTALLETKDPVQDLINEFGSLSESFKADKLAEQLKRVEGALDSLKDKTDDDSKKLKNYLEEARDAMKGGGEETLNFLNKKIKDTEITWGSAFSSIGSQFGDMLGAMTEMQNQYLQNEIDNMQAELDARLEADDITQEEEKEMMNQISDLKARQFEAEKKNSIAQALINGALAITSVWSTQGAVPWLAAAISGLVTATTAMQVATISSQSYQKFERGGIVAGSGITGDKHPILANAGELILTRAQQNSIASQLMQDKAPMVISVDFSGQVFGDERTISEYVYNGIKNAQREGILREW